MLDFFTSSNNAFLITDELKKLVINLYDNVNIVYNKLQHNDSFTFLTVKK